MVRRAAVFHKPIIAQNMSVFKELVKPVDSLRSQVSKNACLALQGLFNELTSSQTDGQIDTVLPILLKRAADTNQFISEQAMATLVIIVNNCSDARVFNSLQSQALKTNGAKEKVGYCYTALLEKMGPKVRNFSHSERMIQVIVSMLTENAAEVRNQAKMAVHTL